MADVNLLISERLKKNARSSKMAAMAEQSANGKLSSFAGVFSLSELSSFEKNHLEAILKEHSPESEEDLANDLQSLITITSEVKAINNQAALLHGERIKKAHDLLSPYRDGAFTSWLTAVYGNRQTPYNFLQYYLFYENLPQRLRQQLENMPKQAVYTLASREGDFLTKQKMVEDYQGETKQELLLKIRSLFPLDQKDKRNGNPEEQIARFLRQALISLRHLGKKGLSKSGKQTIQKIMDELQKLITT